MSKTIKIENYIDLQGETVLFDTLPKEKQKEACEKIWDLMMEHAGFITWETDNN